MRAVPLSSAAAQSFYVLFGSTFARLRVRWRPLPARWYITVSLGSTDLTVNRQMTVWTPLVLHSAFPGDLMVWPLKGGNDDPLRTSWGETHELRWLEPEELGRP